MLTEIMKWLIYAMFVGVVTLVVMEFYVFYTLDEADKAREAAYLQTVEKAIFWSDRELREIQRGEKQ